MIGCDDVVFACWLNQNWVEELGNDSVHGGFRLRRIIVWLPNGSRDSDARLIDSSGITLGWVRMIGVCVYRCLECGDVSAEIVAQADAGAFACEQNDSHVAHRLGIKPKRRWV